MSAVPDHGPKGELADDFVQGPLGDEEFLGDVAEAVAEGAEEGEQIALDLVACADGVLGAGGAGDVVARDEDADAADADQDADDLGDVVAHAQEAKRDDDDGDDGEEVDELRGEDGGVAVGEHGEVVPLHVEEGEDDVFPAMAEHEAAPAGEAVAVEGEGGVDKVEQDVVEEGLEGGDGGALGDE